MHHALSRTEVDFFSVYNVEKWISRIYYRCVPIVALVIVVWLWVVLCCHMWGICGRFLMGICRLELFCASILCC